MGIMLSNFGTGVGNFKCGIYGPAGSGKTFTATGFALGIKAFKKHPGDIAFQDTETGGEYVNKVVKAATGRDIIGIKSRTLADAIAFLHECVKLKVAVAIVDSVTHIWEEVQKSFLSQLNAARRAKNRQPKDAIEWQDRGPLNDLWQQFTDPFINLPIDIIICGRSANIWEMSVDQETGKKELNKIGTKMKTQSELAYEPSFLVEMEREQIYDAQGVQKIVRTMTVMKDRFQLLDGKTFQNPTFESIRPHIEQLTPGAQNTVDTTKQTPVQINDHGDGQYEPRQREIMSQEIAGLLEKEWPGQSAEHKALKVEVIFRLMNTRAWAAVESTHSSKLKEVLLKLPQAILDLKTEKAKSAVPAEPEKKEKVGK